MRNPMQVLSKMLKGLKEGVLRFPLTVICLLGAASILCYMVEANNTPIFLEKLVFTFIFGAMLGAAVQAASERFGFNTKRRIISIIISVLITALYYLTIAFAPKISDEVVIRTIVAVFAMLCLFVWLPSYKGRLSFSSIALTHFKNVFISILYSGVLFLGLAAIIAAIDTLLFEIDYNSYAYTAIIVFILFAPIHYLSQLPCFSSDDQKKLEQAEELSKCPKFLDVLISYIFIPLIFAYTAVLAAYFIKIAFTLKWPSGQLGPMVLAYSAAGIIIYILSCVLDNKFTKVYRRIFPIALIPIVIMQLISVAIRLNAYGVTESRYYVLLFGVFSLICGIILTIYKQKANGAIALLVAGFAIISILPPIDAFTVSRISQTARLEHLLTDEGMLSGGVLTAKADASIEAKLEITNITNYLYNRGYIPYIKWLRKDFKPYEDFKEVMGFEPLYSHTERDKLYLSANIDRKLPIDISGYDVAFKMELYNLNKNVEKPSYEFEMDNKTYTLTASQLENGDKKVFVMDMEGNEIISTQLYDIALPLAKEGQAKAMNLTPPKDLTVNIKQNDYTMRIVFESIFLNTESIEDSHYSVIIMIGIDK